VGSGLRRALTLGVAALIVVGIFVGGIAFVNRGSAGGDGGTPTTTPLALSCIGGSEKAGLMADAQVKEILQSKYGITVAFQSMGSYDQVSMTDEEIAKRGADCLWPSSVSAQYVFEATHTTSSYAGYRAQTVLQSPEVIYAGPAGTAALVKAGIVERRGTEYLIVDLKRLMTDYIGAGKTWKDLNATGVSGPVQISSTDPAKSNSGFTLYQLMLAMLATSDVYQAPDVAAAKQALPELRSLYDSQGLQARSSDAGFEQWLLQGGEAHAPLYAGYESQIIQKIVQYADNADAKKLLTEDVRVLYPEPTIYSDHPILALNADAGRFVEAMKDPEIQAIAWKTYGFRSGTEIGLAKVSDFPDLPLAQQIKTTSPPNAAVTQLLLSCIRDNVCA
jgi:ABC-type Fe3+ transport system substrate-binding protein